MWLLIQKFILTLSNNLFNTWFFWEHWTECIFCFPLHCVYKASGSTFWVSIIIIPHGNCNYTGRGDLDDSLEDLGEAWFFYCSKFS